MFTMGAPLRGGNSDPNFLSVKSLLHFEDAAGTTIPADRAAGVTWLNNGTTRALVSTTDAKFGSSSLERPAVAASTGGLYTTSIAAPAGSFTAEFFVKFTSFAFGNSNGFFLFGGLSHVIHANVITATGKFDLIYDGTDAISTLTAVTGTWYHVAITYDGTTVRMYVDGTSIASHAPGAIAYGTGFKISPGCRNGYAGDEGGNFVDEFRYTDGVVRYTGSFTPPTAAFPDF